MSGRDWYPILVAVGATSVLMLVAGVLISPWSTPIAIVLAAPFSGLLAGLTGFIFFAIWRDAIRELRKKKEET